jgi:4,5-dihydroxyphthalate decarboxylase
MSKLRLSLAIGDYDITRALLDGTVRPQGVDPITMTYPSPQRHWRMLRHREFDVAELSLGSYVAQRSRGDDELVAIPVFPHRRFRHGYAFVSAAASIRRASDLADRQVGLRSWQTTAGVWLRGILAEHHDLRVDSVRWMTQDPEDVSLDLPPQVALNRVPAGANVTDMCARGEIAGLIYPELPRQVLSGEPSIVRLFEHPKTVEQAYFRETGIFPIMHVVAVRAHLFKDHPWLALNLMSAFEEAKRLAYRRLDDPRTVSLAWLRSLQEEEREILGTDPWSYGLDPTNRHVLDTFLRYAKEQGVAAKRMTPESLFQPATLDHVPAYV